MPPTARDGAKANVAQQPPGVTPKYFTAEFLPDVLLRTSLRRARMKEAEIQRLAADTG